MPTPAAAPPDGGALFKFLVDQAPAVVWSTDRDLRFTSCMGASLRHLGLTSDKAVGRSLYDHFGTRDPDFPPIAKHRKALAGEKSVFELEWGSRVFHARVEPFRNQEGAVIGTLGLAIDITERKRAEAALQDSESRWKAVVNQAPDFILVIDREGRIFYINRLTGNYKPEEVVGTDSLLFLHPSSRAVALDAYHRAFDTATIVTYEVEYMDRKGNTAWFRNRVGPLLRNGVASNLILVATDINDSKRTEAALKDSVAQMRRLAARLEEVREEERKRIALDIHDRLGQSLTGLKLDLSSLALRIGSDREGKRRARAILRSLDDTIQTVREISTDLRPAVLDGLGLKAAIEWQTREFRSRTGLSCSMAFPRRDLPLDADSSTAVFRIFQEILTNVARHAKASRVSVTLAAARDRLVLTVTDDGKGISKKALKDPASLGLLGMRERALAFGGAVEVLGRRGRGTEVTVTVPLPRKEAS